MTMEFNGKVDLLTCDSSPDEDVADGALSNITNVRNSSSDSEQHLDASAALEVPDESLVASDTCLNAAVNKCTVSHKDDRSLPTATNLSRGPSPPLQTYTKSLETKRKRREEKTVDLMLRAVGNIECPTEKLNAVCAKYAELADENRLMQRTMKETQKLYTKAVKEKEVAENETAKQLLAKAKLENLCRELQKQNRIIKEESVNQLKEQEHMRKQVSDKFQSALADVHEAMEAGKDRSAQLHGENTMLQQKMHALVEQYEAKEEHTKRLLDTRDLEVQLLDTKLKQAKLQAAEVTEQLMREKADLLKKLQEKCQELNLCTMTEVNLKEQLAMYAEKYEEFQGSLKSSNEVFQKFKSEMDTMTKKLVTVEKETKQWKAKWEGGNKALIEMAQQKVELEEKIRTLTARNQKLEDLCRTLHAHQRMQLATGANNTNSGGDDTIAGANQTLDT